ncbi:glutathione S-transferase T3 [Arabidopsis lyrata subsp. lyrata]|uniref:glutathione S-transferase T3 n=1 Tax=Arabidopsis lyrata subsp. lyrata TaxID=81972 RepID=UPI000A29DD1E|nr:glutathione S-transferase T3 [Arabidopsis lyrata subsp. lyrata]XP_020871501.1 glutathione S-transferase T3 [Arabidopsis lyrata subsp. lyrata]|eukprot:XP_020871500.1 glutathione S-transferase T3 [Arabidopsis lyrata subsp. lyrata]
MDSSNPFTQSSGFLDLLNSQPWTENEPSQVPIQNDQWSKSIQAEDTPEGKKGKRNNWSAKEDVVLISAWLNTSKDPVVANEERKMTFWSRIATYFAASSALVGMPKREPDHCKQRWRKINDQVCKFVGSLAAATSQKSSGQNENDVMKLAHQIYSKDYGVKFTLDHCWRELRHDQKWCVASSPVESDKSKRRKVGDRAEAAGHSSSSQAASHGDEAMARPPGVKAAKAKAKKTNKGVEEGPDLDALLRIQSIWEIRKQDHELKKEDYELKKKQSKLKMLENLLGKIEPLSEIEMALKDKLITDMLS